MLQDIGKTLGLSAIELEALLEVRDELRKEQLAFFDMRDGCFCISGHMGRWLGMEKDGQYTELIGALPLKAPMRQLCYPPQSKDSPHRSYGYHVGQVEAARAIDRMLAGGDPWPLTS